MEQQKTDVAKQTNLGSHAFIVIYRIGLVAHKHLRAPAHHTADFAPYYPVVMTNLIMLDNIVNN